MKEEALRKDDQGKQGVREDHSRRRGGRANRRPFTAVAAWAVAWAVLLVGVQAAPLGAQAYPDRPLKIIIPYPPGGASDFLGRIVGEELAKRLGKPVVPENRPGAGANIGIEAAAKAAPDGYTILTAANTIAIGVSLYKKLNFDASKDFAPISQTTMGQQLICVRPSLPVKNLKELVAYAKANPGKLNFGSGGVGTGYHLAAVMFNNLAGIEAVHVAYKGGNQAMLAAMSNEVDLVIGGVGTSLTHVRSGKVRALAVSSEKRLAELPDVPTAREAGFDFVATTWSGIFTSAGTPPAIVNRLSAEWAKAAATPAVREKLLKAEFEPVSSTPEEFTRFFKAEVARYRKVIHDNKISVSTAE